MDDSSELSWDNKYAATKILLAHLTGVSQRINAAIAFCDKIVYGTQRTADNMVFIQKWGSTRHAANVAFACMALGKYVPNQAELYTTFWQRANRSNSWGCRSKFSGWVWKQPPSIRTSFWDHLVQQTSLSHATGGHIVVVYQIQIF